MSHKSTLKLKQILGGGGGQSDPFLFEKRILKSNLIT